MFWVEYRIIGLVIPNCRNSPTTWCFNCQPNTCYLSCVHCIFWGEHIYVGNGGTGPLFHDDDLWWQWWRRRRRTCKVRWPRAGALFHQPQNCQKYLARRGAQIYIWPPQGALYLGSAFPSTLSQYVLTRLSAALPFICKKSDWVHLF